MKFHLKMTLCMLAVLAVLFGAGGSLLISESFEDSLEREKAAALGDYRMAWGTLQIVNSMDAYLDRDAIVKTMEQLYQQNSASWSALRLSTGDEVLYENRGTQSSLIQTAWSIEDPTPGICLFRILDNGAGAHFLVFSGAVETNGDVLYLTTSHDVSALYTARQAQQHTYLQVFFLMCVLCAALSYTVSRLLTAPLGGLSRASRAIAAGNFASRVRVRSNDKIGAVSTDFNTMAEKMEQTVSELNRAVEELHQAMERQEQFTGSFAHEMKTPMTSLIGYAELLRSGTLTPEEQLEAADYLYSEGKRLESLSHKLLELLVLKRHDLPFAKVSPAELIEALVERLRPLYAAKGIRLSCVCKAGACLMDADLVWSLLLNLADNAQKAIEQGGEIQFRQEMLADGCLIHVLDSGRGIPPQALEHLTEAFYRVDKARSRAQGGFGLGLSLCREIAALHNGRIRFENRPEGGACVTVDLRGGPAMRTIKRYILPLFTLLLITVGAAMPLAVSQMQDSRISSLREEFLLNTVNLTLQQDVGVSPVLRLIAGECNSVLWEEETKLTEQDAIEAAKAVLTEMEAMDLLSVGDLALIRDAEGRAEPILLIGGDGSSALVWNCYSYSENVPYQMWIDDTTGKAVQFLVSSPTPRDTDAAHALTANWNIFFQGYYGIEIVSVKEESQGIDSGGILYQFVFGADLQDGLDVCELELKLFGGLAIFK